MQRILAGTGVACQTMVEAGGQERFVFLGADPSGRILVTVFTSRGNTLRIISARKASRAERRTYETRQ